MVLGNLAQPNRLVLGHPALKMLAACSFVFSIAQLSLTTYLVTYLSEPLTSRLVAAGLALSIAQLGGVVGRILWGWGGRPRRRRAAHAGAEQRSDGLAVARAAAVAGAGGAGRGRCVGHRLERRLPGRGGAPGTTGAGRRGHGGTLAFTFFGVVLGPPVFGALSALFETYRAGYLALAVPTGLCCVALLRARLSARGADGGR